MTTDQADQAFIAEALPLFLSEAHQQSEEMEQLLLRLEDAPGDRELLDALFRCAHTVKGSAGIFGLRAVVGFTHHVETLLDRLRDGQLQLTPGLGTLLLEANDHLRALISSPDSGATEEPALAPSGASLVSRLAAASGQPAADAHAAPGAAPGDPTASAPASAAVPGRWRVSLACGPDTFRNGTDPLALLHYLGGFGTVLETVAHTRDVPALEALDPESCHLALDFAFETSEPASRIESAFAFACDDCVVRIEGDPAASRQAPTASAQTTRSPSPAPVPAPPTRAGGSVDESRFIRVHADRLDEVITLLGELVIAGAGASLLARQSRQSALVEAHLQITRLIEEVRNGTLQLRMVPIGDTFSRFRRVVRDTAADLGKDVALEIVGGDTELDKSVVERIADPLTHLVRNALDHGLESPAERVAAGKPAQGRLTLAACHESGSILIRITDDGRGIQRDKVLQRARERGLVAAGAELSDAEVFRLIFEPGFSTAETVTDLSGRGVGMDVVRRNIEALRGTVAVTSEPGAGATIMIRLPLTLAIIDGFLVGVGTSKFVFPLDAVVEVIESRRGDTAVDAHGRGCVELRGQVLPVVCLRGLYGLDAGDPERSSIVVLRGAGQRFGVRVDVLLGQHQTVIKPLGRMFRSLRGMSGSSILGTGEVALIVDTESLGALAAAGRPSLSSSSPLRKDLP